MHFWFPLFPLSPISLSPSPPVCLTSLVPCLTSLLPCLLFYVPCLTSLLPCLLSYVPCLTSLFLVSRPCLTWSVPCLPSSFLLPLTPFNCHSGPSSVDLFHCSCSLFICFPSPFPPSLVLCPLSFILAVKFDAGWAYAKIRSALTQPAPAKYFVHNQKTVTKTTRL